jgi:hypothetical protein
MRQNAATGSGSCTRTPDPLRQARVEEHDSRTLLPSRLPDLLAAKEFKRQSGVESGSRRRLLHLFWSPRPAQTLASALNTAGLGQVDFRRIEPHSRIVHSPDSSGFTGGRMKTTVGSGG